MGKKAVVLGGGGSRGSYQVGVWKALTELGFDYTVVTGTSVGALNGAFMAQQEFPLVEKMWKSIRTADVMDIRVDGKVEGVRDLTDKAGAFLAEMVKNGGADPRPLENMLREYTDEEKIRQSPIDFGFVTVAFPSMEPKTFTKSTVPKGQLVDHLMASAACFPAMKARVIDQKTYIDGGYWDNVPVQMAVEMGADDIIAVDLDSIGVVRKLRFPGVRVRHLKSRWDLGVFLLFDGDVTVRNMQLGYLETMKLFGKKEGVLYTFSPGETEKLYRRVKGPAQLFMAKSGMYLIPGNTYTAHARAARKLRQLLDRPEGRLSDSQMTLAAAEAAARFFDLSPTKEYTAERMEALLLESLTRQEQEAQKLPALFSAGSVKELQAYLKGLSGQMVLLYCVHCLEEMMQGRFPPSAARVLCSAVTEEFLAAMYLCSLKRAAKKDEKTAEKPEKTEEK
ncbi:MAG: patatin-like phospholipase family protein [Oscillospiraceae bacterium]|nr:patatin-like phospholipase family protein [Oscillospiraceae bacterium]